MKSSREKQVSWCSLVVKFPVTGRCSHLEKGNDQKNAEDCDSWCGISLGCRYQYCQSPSVAFRKERDVVIEEEEGI